MRSLKKRRLPQAQCIPVELQIYNQVVWCF